MTSRTRLVGLVALVAVIAAAVFALAPPLSQPAWYHDFADGRTWLSVPNFLDTGSNLFFLIAGVAGWTALHRAHFIDPRECRAYRVFFAGLIVTAFASAWYHFAPTDARLVGDRLAMTVAFAGFFAALVQERTDGRAGRRVLAGLLVVAPGTVLYWYGSELAGAGDLRAYFLLQGLLMLLAPVLIAFWPGRYDRGGDWLMVVGLYVLALVLEWLDKPVFGATGFVSGHTLKHLVAAAAGGVVLRHMLLRRPSGTDADSVSRSGQRATSGRT